ncbi:MAG: bifunctional 3-deoxy-7-phosphoheptulonate synthase/chorismate mutase type II [Bacteroidales bacterium]|nr:bifunctional 3-deoxy-7-phosphoheptulonate synthase/chorismate mutase type II [Bacteroidales bacterium]
MLALKDWIKSCSHPLVIAGPCSAETEEQVLQTAQGLSGNEHIKIFRAGVWKPRTRPSAFEGAGEQALGWLQKVKEQTGLMPATEIANVKHLELALKYGIDIIWLGARTTTNPFSVQEIAEGLKGKDIAVLVKNPVMPDLQLWLGAIERINNAGIKKIIAVHRGFNSLQRGRYRNSPEWRLVIELKRLHPELPVICDPSHISGTRLYLAEVAQMAMDLGLAGLMVEAHIDPANALSDKRQQLTPSSLLALLKGLKTRNEYSGSPSFDKILLELRTKIDLLDEQLLQFMSQRMQLVREIAGYKDKNDVTILQIKRWDEIIKNRLAKADELNLNKDFIQLWYNLIHEESIIVQTEIMNKNKNK